MEFFPLFFSVNSAVSHRRAAGVRGTNGVISVVNDTEAHEIGHHQPKLRPTRPTELQ